MVLMPGVGWEHDTETQTEQEAYWEAGAAMWTKVGASDEPADLESSPGPLVDRLLLTKGIRSVDYNSRLSSALHSGWR